MAPTMRLSITRCLGVFRSPKAFLKSLITLLKDILLVLVEDIEADREEVFPMRPPYVSSLLPLPSCCNPD
jgi:hypothetical protein